MNNNSERFIKNCAFQKVKVVELRFLLILLFHNRCFQRYFLNVFLVLLVSTDYIKCIFVATTALVETYLVSTPQAGGFNPSESDQPFDDDQHVHRSVKMVRHMFNKSGGSESKRVRYEEPQVGAIVLINSVSILDKYLEGPPRHPFLQPQVNFVIVVASRFDKDLAAHLMQVLWREYRIRRAILICSCSDSEVIAGLQEIRFVFKMLFSDYWIL